MNNLNLYQLAQYIIGDLPSEYQFIYIIFTMIEALILMWCLFSPFILAYSLVKE